MQKVYQRRKELDWPGLDEALSLTIIKCSQVDMSESYKATVVSLALCQMKAKMAMPVSFVFTNHWTHTVSRIVFDQWGQA